MEKSQTQDRWKIVKSLGEGGQAHTFLVNDTQGSQDVQYVLKRLKNLSPQRVERFRREIDVVRALAHPNIINLVDFDLKAPKPYFVTEYCSGGTLEDLGEFKIAGWYPGTLPTLEDILGLDGALVEWQRALAVFLEVCEGLAYIHQKGIVHRDIKPANILLRTPNGPAVIADFGLGYIGDDARLTQASEVVGPRWFVAPELEDGGIDEVTPACDVYSLGKLLYWLLSGGKVFSREKHRLPAYDLVRLRRDTRMEHVNRLLDRMLLADTEKRLKTANAVIWPTRRVAHLLAGGYNAVSSRLPQYCQYCGQGIYSFAVIDTGHADYGVPRIGDAEWRVLVCDQCGHVQQFRVDHAQMQDWWKN